jgi:hypothetical protein
VHTREDESWYVIEGELLFDVGDQQLTAKPGSLVYAPRNVPHGYRVTKAPARWLIIFTPAGIEPLFAEVGELRKRFPNQDGEYREELEKLQAKYGDARQGLAAAVGICATVVWHAHHGLELADLRWAHPRRSQAMRCAAACLASTPRRCWARTRWPVAASSTRNSDARRSQRPSKIARSPRNARSPRRQG